MSTESSPTVIKYADGVKVVCSAGGVLKMLPCVKITVSVHTTVCGSVTNQT